MKHGFFSAGELSTNKAAAALSTKGLRCGRCGLYKHCDSPKMQPTGDGALKILFIAEAPGEDEDRLGTQLVGATGKFLRRILHRLDIDLDHDCRKINAINCHPDGNAEPTDLQIDSCRALLSQELREHPPDLIIPCGTHAMKSLLLHRWNGDPGSITRWHGFHIPDRDLNAWVAPIFHPSYAMRNQREDKDDVVNVIFKRDLANALDLLDAKRPTFPEERENVRVLTEPDAERYLAHLLEDPPERIAFDYETTGLKPHRTGHRIVCVSVATSPTDGAAFMLTERLIPLWVKVLKSDIPKMAHNMKFEESWSVGILGTPVNAWDWCSMQAAHILDNRRMITGLKFQAYVRYGLMDYSSHLSDMLEGDDSKNANSFNQCEEIDPRDLLLYCGVDSLVEFRLAIDQMREMKETTDDPNLGECD